MRKQNLIDRLASRFVSRFRRRLPKDAFLPIVDDDGRTVGIMDHATAEYLHSTAPNPSQSSLDAVFARTTRVRVIDWEEVATGTFKRTQVLAEFADAKSLTRLRECLQIVEDPSTFGHCMCIGEEAIELNGGSGTLATIGLHHGRLIRWHAWKHDAMLNDGPGLLTFLAERGVPGPLERYQQALRDAEDAERAAKR
jgi:hypothetical protein